MYFCYTVCVTMDQELSVQTLRQFLNVHMELKWSISEQLMSYSTKKCSYLPARRSCILTSNTRILEYTNIWRKTMKLF